jgi:predicted O-linked N-acetylglucosamine transferase (SPINDLY family)
MKNEVTTGINQLIQQAMAHYHAGRVVNAVSTAEHVIKTCPDHAGAHHLLGIIAAQQGEYQKAADLINQALMINPEYAEAHISQGNVYRAMGRQNEAITAYTNAIRLNRKNPMAHYNLGNALRDLGKNTEALAAYNAASQLDFPAVDIHYNRVACLKDLGRHDEALEVCNTVIQEFPPSAEAYVNLAATLNDLGRHADALAACDQAILIDPRSCLAHFIRGNILEESGHPQDALESYSQATLANPRYIEARINHDNLLYKLGRADEALQACKQTAIAFPGSAEAHYNYGNLLRDSGQLDAALAAYNKAIACNPDYAAAHGNQGQVLADLWRLPEAISACEETIRLDPGSAEAYCNLANAQMELCEMDAAEKNYRHALELKPSYAAAHSNLLFLLAARGTLPPDEMLAEQRRWNTIQGYAAQHNPLPHVHLQPLTERRLRIGYVSPDLRKHAVSYFFEPLLAAHDRNRFEVFCYASHYEKRSDETTRRLQGIAQHWHFVKHLGDRELALLIQNDAIDVLVDLAGHTANNRLLAFTYRPAPIQATYLGFFGSSGLEAMDYWITDEVLHPGDSPEKAAESIYRLPRCAFCYQPPADAPPVAPCPNHGEQVVFGSFSSLSKLNDGVISTWSSILNQLPGSKLLVMAKPLGDSAVRSQLLDRFNSSGIRREQLIFNGMAALSDYLSTYAKVDIILDTYPRTGGTTTAEALWMGVPVITLAGNSYAGRISASKLTAMELDDLVTNDIDSYISTAVALARDPERRSQLRITLRNRMAGSSLCNGRELAHTLETAYLEMAENSGQ